MLITMRIYVFIITFIIASAQTVFAQDFLDSLQVNKPGCGSISIMQTAEIDNLVNNTKLIKGKKTPQADNKALQQNKANGTDNTQNNITKNNSGQQQASQNQPQQTESTAGNPNATTKSKKVTTYRIQVFAGGNSRTDRQNAERTGNAMRKAFPHIPTYVHFYSPRWICRMGNFRTYQEASEVLKDVKAMGYRQACIVKGTVNVKY